MLPLRQRLFGKHSALPVKPLEPIVHELDGRSVVITLKRHATARRMVLRLARDGENFVMTLPKRQSLQSAKAFVVQSQIWMQNTLARRGRETSQGDDASVLLRGEPVTIERTGTARGHVRFDSGTGKIHVPGRDDHWKRRLVDWLKREAEADLARASGHYAEKMDARFVKVTVRDQKSRWGSCTSDGNLSYSWRLIMAPPFVLDYVAAHEVAHLQEMNHGPRFWRLVLSHCPMTRQAKRWLVANGHRLHHGL
jgi:predicted metal-dependent hydrolase